jgi:hypothetical protein
MKTKIAVIIVMLLLGTLCPCQVVLASDLFYAGNIIIDSFTIIVEADEEATVSAVYVLENRGKYSEKVDLQFAQSQVPLEAEGGELYNPVVFEPYEKKSINLTYNLNITGETTKRLFLDPTMLFNGKPNAKPTNASMIKVLLPQGTNHLAWANQQPHEEGFEDGRKFYSWSNIDNYPTMLCLKWSTLQVEISVKKSVTPQEITALEQVINIEISIQNKGDTAVNRVSLTDQYVSFEFAAVDPLWEFGDYGPWLIWRKNINSLEPGEAQNLTYSVKYIGVSSYNYDFDLKPCVVTVDGHLIVVSNEVRVSQSGSIIPAPADTDVPMESEAEPLNLPSIPLLGGILLILAIVIGGYLIRRRKRWIKESQLRI